MYQRRQRCTVFRRVDAARRIQWSCVAARASPNRRSKSPRPATVSAARHTIINASSHTQGAEWPYAHCSIRINDCPAARPSSAPGAGIEPLASAPCLRRTAPPSRAGSAAMASGSWDRGTRHSGRALARRLFSSWSEIKMLAVPFLRSMRTVAGLDQRQSPSRRRLRRSVEDRWRAGGARCRPSPTQGRACTPFLRRAAGGCNVTIPLPRIADRPRAANEQNAVPSILSLGSSSGGDSPRAPEHVAGPSNASGSFGLERKRARNSASSRSLHDRIVEQVAAQDDEAGVLLQWLVDRHDDVVIVRMDLGEFSPIVLPLTVSAFSWMSLRFINSLTTAGTPPAR